MESENHQSQMYCMYGTPKNAKNGPMNFAVEKLSNLEDLEITSKFGSYQVGSGKGRKTPWGIIT